jgi:hypothetical protein
MAACWDTGVGSVGRFAVMCLGLMPTIEIGSSAAARSAWV